MKTNAFFLFVGFTISLCFSKPIVWPADYRDAYTGKYFCKRNCQTSNPIQKNECLNSLDTITVIVTKDIIDSILDIKMRRTTFKVKINNNIMTSYPSGGHWGGKFFKENNISFYSLISPGSPSCTYNGEKK